MAASQQAGGPLARDMARASLVGLIYFLLARSSLVFVTRPENIVIAWLPGGFALAILILGRRRDWPAVLAAVFAADVMASLSGGVSVPISLGLALAHCVEPALAAWLMQRFLPPPIAFDDLKHVAGFVLILPVSTSISALAGAAVPALGRGAPLWDTWLAWYPASGIGMLLTAPLIVCWATRANPPDSFSGRRRFEFVFLLVALTAVAQAIFGIERSAGAPVLPMPYLTLPFLFWAALRFGPRGATAASAVLGVLSLGNTALGFGPFVITQGQPLDQALAAQGFIAVACLSALAPAAVLAERRRAEDALRQSESRYASLFNNHHAVMLLVDPGTGDIVDANPAACAYYGYTRETITRMRISDINTLSPEAVARETQAARTENRNRFLFRHRLASGDVRDVDVYSGPVAADERTLLFSVVHDVTERRRAEDELRKLSRAVEQSSASIVITDPAGNIEYVNPAFCRTTGYAREEVIGQNPRILKSGHTPPEEYRRMWQTLAAGGDWRGEFHNKKKNGEMYWESATLSPVFDADGRITHYVAVKENITERKQAEDEIRRFNTQLEQRVAERTRELAEAIARLTELDALKSKFVSDVSHELRTPITNLRLYLDLLERGRPDKRESYLATLCQQAARLSTLIEDILNLSRLEMSRDRIALGPIDLNAIVEQVVTAHLPRADATGLRLSFEPDRALPPVRGESNQIAQVVTNLVTNALNYTPAGEVRVSTRLAHSDQHILLTVTDTGIGIDPEDLPNLFQRFYRGRRATTSPVRGTGLGLGIVKEIVDLHGGRIRVESRSGEGSTFEVTLPVDAGVGRGDVSTRAA